MIFLTLHELLIVIANAAEVCTVSIILSIQCLLLFSRFPCGMVVGVRYQTLDTGLPDIPDVVSTGLPNYLDDTSNIFPSSILYYYHLLILVC
jgi:hypothetical protein